MKQFLLLLSVLLCLINISAQQNQTDYFLGNRTYCQKPDNERVNKIYPLGIRAVQQNKYLGAAFKIFAEVIEADNSFCDAYFWAAYTLRLSNTNLEDAVIFYHAADSLAQNRSIEFKQNLATLAMKTGRISFSRNKFKEMTQYFPASPEGYYGIALTSLFLEDYKNGLENIDIAEKKYNTPSKDCQSIKAILLTLNEKYEEAIPYFEKAESNFKKDDIFNGCYALSLKQVGIKNSDEKLMKKYKKYYEKVQNKTALPEAIKNSFKE
ncbi:tetratricopeptide repeat protein [Chryseobacterium sp. JK1]|uniref:tetratricopeptide repeat protein n=1 Tax=Chryseobacterium sp. JK1 TaxID=874294 RepID=UPI003D694843